MTEGEALLARGRRRIGAGIGVIGTAIVMLLAGLWLLLAGTRDLEAPFGTCGFGARYNGTECVEE